MFDLDRWEEIFETIRKNKLRTFLTGLSVLSGIFILVVLLGVGQGIQNGVEKEFQNDAANRISVWTERTAVEYKGLNPNRDIQLKNKDYNLIAEKYEDQLQYKSSLYRIWSSIVSYKDESGNYRVEGALPDNQFLENESMLDGRYLNYNDQKNYAKVTVIGNKVKNDLFDDSTSPLGKMIEVAGLKFKIVGVYSDPGGDREERRIFIPLSTAQRVFSAGQDIRNMAFTMPKQENFDEALETSKAFTEKIEKQLKEAHTIAPEDDRAIGIRNSLEEAKRIYTLTGNIKLFFWFVGIATILAGVVGVGNIMLIIVKERTKEIGIRKALGAEPWPIVWMVLHESIFITTIAGFLGLFLGMILLEFVGPLIKSDFLLHPTVNFQVAVSTVIILVVAGAMAGFIPAWKAARIKPIIALRDE